MDRFDPFVKYADVYGDIINWEKDPMNRPQNQNKYFFSDGKTYYEQLLRIMRLVSVFKDAFNQIYNNEDEVSGAWENFVDNLTATAVAGEEPAVELVWTDDSVSFNFVMPPGLPGPQGPEGPQGVSVSSITFNQDYTMTITLSNGQTYTSGSLRGADGQDGAGLEILDVYPTLSDLQTAHPTGSPGDAYQVGSGDSFILYIWSSSHSAWANAGSLGSVAPSDASPSMNGTASAGSSQMYSRGDHVHPKDTTKLDKSSTNGVYAVANGSQVMIPASSSATANAIARYDSNGDIHAHGLSLDADAEITGDVSADNGVFNSSVSAPTITASSGISGGTISGTNITATGNISGVNITGSGTISGDDITASGDISATGNISGADITGTGTITGDDITATGDISASGDISGANITGSGTITGNDISITNNTILNSNKLAGIAGSTNAYQILTTLGADRDVLGMSADATDNTPSVKFMAGKWANNGTMGDATSEVKFNNSFAPDYNYDPTGGRIGLAPASASVLGGVKVGRGLAISNDGILSNNFSNILSGDIDDIKYNFQGYIGNSVTSKPTTNGGGLCCVMQLAGLYGYQLFNSNGSSDLYFRNLTSGTWSAWRKIVTEAV